MSDADYLEQQEFAFFSKDLLRLVEFHKPDDVLDFAISYFRAVQSGCHVTGTNYSYVIESNHNRRSLVMVIMSALRGYEDDEDITPSEFHLLVEALCTGFPKSLVLQAATSTAEHFRMILLTPDSKYNFVSLSRAVYCHILYGEWLKFAEELFSTGENTKEFPVAELESLRPKLDEFYESMPKGMWLPPRCAVLNALAERQEVDSSLNERIRIDRFRYDVFRHAAVIAEIAEIAKAVDD